ncbi:MAG: hypothetical protein WAV11_01430 [Minisyncoccia bacterium]
MSNLAKKFLRWLKEKMFKNVARKLLRGSRNIDLMKSETHETISIIIGLMDDRCDYDYEMNFDCKISHFCRWIIYKKQPGKSHKVKCFLWVDGINERTAYDSEKVRGGIPYLEAQFIYESLPLFIEGLFIKFPELRALSKPFLMASKKF